MRLLRSTALVAGLVLFSAAAHAQQPQPMSDSEKKSTARVAFTEGLKLQDDGKPAEALAKFEIAEKYFDAPTHLLHIAECQALTGKLVEASENYETLIHKNLGDSPSEAFTEAQERAKAELPSVRARIPTLKVTTKPDPANLKSLQITVNGELLGSDLTGLARPVNPGKYKINASAQGYKLALPPAELTIAEKEQKAIELAFVPGQSTPVVVTPPPPPPPYGQTQPPPRPYESNAEPPKVTPSSTGLLFGLSGGLLIPGGGVTSANQQVFANSKLSADRNFGDFAGAGGSFGIDFFARLARMLLLGARLEFGGLSGPSGLSDQAVAQQPVTTKTSTFFIGANVGILPNVDKVSFYGILGVGYRHVGRTIELDNVGSTTESLGGVEGELGLGIMFPIGPIRILPRVGLTAGSFSSVDSTCIADLKGQFDGCVEKSGTSPTHVFLTVGLGVLYHFDLAKKVVATQ